MDRRRRKASEKQRGNQLEEECNPNCNRSRWCRILEEDKIYLWLMMILCGKELSYNHNENKSFIYGLGYNIKMILKQSRETFWYRAESSGPGQTLSNMELCMKERSGVNLSDNPKLLTKYKLVACNEVVFLENASIWS